jgi:hypothetical protein
MQNRSFILEFKNAGMKEFIQFWQRYYNDGKYPEKEYLFHLKKDCRLMPEDLLYLLEWKNGKPLSKKKQLIYENAKKNLDGLMKYRKLEKFKADYLSELYSLVSEIVRTGLIWRIFLMHVARPDVFPLFDQHVYRTYFFLKNGEITDKTLTEDDMKLYQEYYSYVTKLGDETSLGLRTIDKAFFAFGKFLKEHKGGITRTLKP